MKGRVSYESTGTFFNKFLLTGLISSQLPLPFPGLRHGRDIPLKRAPGCCQKIPRSFESSIFDWCSALKKRPDKSIMVSDQGLTGADGARKGEEN